MTYEITFWMKIQAKKNQYMPALIGGRARFIKNSRLQKDLDAIACQIPATMRGLNLVHPQIDLYVTVPDGRSDRDNILTTLLDLLVTCGVIKNDSIAQLNAKIIIHPAVISDHFKTVIVLTPTKLQSKR